MSQPTVSVEHALLVCRVTPAINAWIRSRAEARGCSLNEVIVDCLDDHRQLYRLPPEVVARLSREQGQRTPREYIVDVLMQRYAALAAADAQSPGPAHGS